MLLVSIFNFLIAIPSRALGYYARTLLNKYNEFINYNSTLNIFLLSATILALITAGVLNNYSSHLYLLLIILPLQIVILLLITRLNNIKITLSSANSFKVWIKYIKTNYIFRFLETRFYSITALSSALTILFIKIIYVNNTTFSEYYTIVFTISLIAQAVGASIALKKKTEILRNLLLLVFPVTLFDLIFPFISGKIIPITILTFLQSMVAAYVYIHLNSIYQYITSKDIYVNISITQRVLQQIFGSIMVILVSIMATVIGVTFTYIGIALLISSIVLLTLFTDTIKKIKIVDQK
ncbi:hypothetical protein DFR85_02730 [Acidianus brierleyi]|uniref:MFS transporter n=1 Tax=Acidianus brierleyi TaxID=41673 RepID=A0A2U9IIM7_9CREN|nr:hypothetical protein DFR85_02730 [Acidianus brierleyi]